MKKLLSATILIFVCLLAAGCSAASLPAELPTVVSGPGQIAYPDGSSYVGEFKDGLPHGSGVMTYADGSVLTGTFEGGAAQGRGEYAFAPDGDDAAALYTGAFDNGEMTDPNGRLEYVDGSIYEGNIKNGLRHGYGTYTWSDGSYYTGGFIEDEMSGPGTLFCAQDGMTYRGESVDGAIQGSAQVTFPDGVTATATLKDGRLDGQVTLLYPTSRYVTVLGQTYFVQASEGITLVYENGTLTRVADATSRLAQ